DRELEGGRALGAERAAVDRAVGVALDIDDLAVPHADQGRAADGAVGADARHIFGPGDLERAGVCRDRLEAHAQRDCAAHPKPAGGNLQELAPADRSRSVHRCDLLVAAPADPAPAPGSSYRWRHNSASI